MAQTFKEVAASRISGKQFDENWDEIDWSIPVKKDEPMTVEEYCIKNYEKEIDEKEN